MKIKEFIKEFVEELAIESKEVKIDTNIKDLDEWDSIAVMLLIGVVDENFNIALSTDDIQSITTIQTLVDMIGVDKFE